MSKEHDFFNYYCLDRTRNIDNYINVSYTSGDIIRRIEYKIGLIAKIKKSMCFLLYTEDDFETLVYSTCEFIDNHKEDLYLNVQDKMTIDENFKTLNNINIFEFSSLLNFSFIYSDFKDIIDYNWENLNMDSLIEVS